MVKKEMRIAFYVVEMMRSRYLPRVSRISKSSSFHMDFAVAEEDPARPSESFISMMKRSSIRRSPFRPPNRIKESLITVDAWYARAGGVVPIVGKRAQALDAGTKVKTQR